MSCTFSRAVVGDRVKMLLLFVSNTIKKCLPKKFIFINTDTPCHKKAKAC